jgi:tetratricopeptide (TPR) repeat protein
MSATEQDATTTTSTPTTDDDVSAHSVVAVHQLPSPEEVAIKKLQRAGELCELRRFREASRLLGAVIGIRPEDPTAWSLMARARLGRNDSEGALEAARTASSLAPQDDQPHRLSAAVLVSLNRPEEAAAAAAEATRLRPDDWSAHVELAETLMQLPDRLQDAREAARQAAALAPDEARAHLAVGAVEMAAGKLELASEAFRRVLSIDPSNPAAFNELARMQRGRKGMVTSGAIVGRRRLAGRLSRR